MYNIDPPWGPRAPSREPRFVARGKFFLSFKIDPICTYFGFRAAEHEAQVGIRKKSNTFHPIECFAIRAKKGHHRKFLDESEILRGQSGVTYATFPVSAISKLQKLLSTTQPS